MRAQDSPFRPAWWGTDLAAAGVDARPRVGTYGEYEFEGLPPVPFELSGDLAWLAGQPAHEKWAIHGNALEQLPALLEACARDGLRLPTAFIRFMESSALQDRVRSSTACFIFLDAAPVPSAVGGRLLRFLSDQQGCLYWYLHIVEDGEDHSVVCSTDLYGTEEYSEVDDPEEIRFCGESFESFLCRYWLENEIWFAAVDGTPLPDVGPDYIARYNLG
ncbi:hypothetical protein [Stackebrandtia soli]|uniref:hypothetical protein n=1 Tax=Stackebrandtia soli TaxID=1892856 RepID=UPI0039E94E4C